MKGRTSRGLQEEYPRLSKRYDNKLLAHSTYDISKIKKTNNNELDDQIELVIDNPGIDKQNCLGYLVRLKQATELTGLQKFDARAEFFLSDDFVIAAEMENIAFNESNQVIQFASFGNSLATVVIY